MREIITITFEFGSAEIHPDYIIATMNEGVLVSPEMNKELLALVKKYYPKSKFAYITHRIHSYSVDPRVYIETSKIKNLAAIAVVSDNPINLSNAQVEQLFSKKPFRTFKSLPRAVQWANKIVAKND